MAIKKFLTLRSKSEAVNAVIVLTGVILLWKGIGGLLDYYLFPDNPILSDVASIILGLLLLYVDDFALTEISEARKHKLARKHKSTSATL